MNTFLPGGSLCKKEHRIASYEKHKPNQELSIKCDSCVQVCPEGAIDVK